MSIPEVLFIALFGVSTLLTISACLRPTQHAWLFDYHLEIYRRTMSSAPRAVCDGLVRGIVIALSYLYLSPLACAVYLTYCCVRMAVLMTALKHSKSQPLN